MFPLAAKCLSELYKIMVQNVTYVRFRGVDRPNRLPWIRPCAQVSIYNMFATFCD